MKTISFKKTCLVVCSRKQNPGNLRTQHQLMSHGGDVEMHLFFVKLFKEEELLLKGLDLSFVQVLLHACSKPLHFSHLFTLSLMHGLHWKQ